MKIENIGGKWILYGEDGKEIGRFGREDVAKEYMNELKKGKSKEE